MRKHHRFQPNPNSASESQDAGIPTLPFLVTDSVKKIISELGFPVVVFAVNPFIYDGYKTANNKSALYRAMKSLGMNYKFAVCAQPLKGEMVHIQILLRQMRPSRMKQPRNQPESLRSSSKFQSVNCTYKKPMDKAYLCGLQPVRKEELSDKDLQMISREVSLISEQGEPFGV